MPEPRGESRFPNPFYLLVLLSGTVFVTTCLAYLVSPIVLDSARSEGTRPDRERGSVVAAAWLDKHGATLITYETIVLVFSGLAAMASDRFFSDRAKTSR